MNELKDDECSFTVRYSIYIWYIFCPVANEVLFQAAVYMQLECVKIKSSKQQMCVSGVSSPKLGGNV